MLYEFEEEQNPANERSEATCAYLRSSAALYTIMRIRRRGNEACAPLLRGTCAAFNT